MADDGEPNSELLAVRFEKALEKRHPFTLPGALMVIGCGLFFIFWFMSLDDILTNHHALDPFILLDYPLDLDYTTVTVIFPACFDLDFCGIHFGADTSDIVHHTG
jgi:hypothetical protein